jgi:hypothetical protein
VILLDFACAEHGVFESLEQRPGPDAARCPTCGELAPWAPSPIATKVQYGAAVTGGSDVRPPQALDTRALAEGTPTGKWKRETQERHRVERRDQMIKDLG